MCSQCGRKAELFRREGVKAEAAPTTASLLIRLSYRYCRFPSGHPGGRSPGRLLRPGYVRPFLPGLGCPAAKQTHKLTSAGRLKGPLNSGGSSALHFPPSRRPSADSFSSLHQNSRLDVCYTFSFLSKMESFFLHRRQQHLRCSLFPDAGEPTGSFWSPSEGAPPHSSPFFCAAAGSETPSDNLRFSDVSLKAEMFLIPA